MAGVGWNCRSCHQFGTALLRSNAAQVSGLNVPVTVQGACATLRPFLSVLSESDGSPMTGNFRSS
jgi:hypothetical protein